jgi:hypothetical protein
MAGITLFPNSNDMTSSAAPPNPPVLGHHFGAFGHEAKTKTEDNAEHHRTTYQLGNMTSGPSEPKHQSNESGDKTCSPNHRSRDDPCLRGLSRGDCANSFHGLRGHWGTVNEPADHHRRAESEQDADVGSNDGISVPRSPNAPAISMRPNRLRAGAATILLGHPRLCFWFCGTMNLYCQETTR